MPAWNTLYTQGHWGRCVSAELRPSLTTGKTQINTWDRRAETIRQVHTHTHLRDCQSLHLLTPRSDLVLLGSGETKSVCERTREALQSNRKRVCVWGCIHWWKKKGCVEEFHALPTFCITLLTLCNSYGWINTKRMQGKRALTKTPCTLLVKNQKLGLQQSSFYKVAKKN